MPKKSGAYKFRRGDSLGSAAAENDHHFLDTCFIDQGDLAILMDCADPRCIVVGRTGSGKSAILLEVEKKAPTNTCRISPPSLSLNYIANSDVIHVLTALNVNLDPFFKLLWRHAMALQIFQHIRPIADAEKKEGIGSWIRRLIRQDKTTQEKAARHDRVVAFLNQHGGADFWGDFGQRVQGIVYKLETEVKQALKETTTLSGGMTAPFKASAELSDREDQSRTRAATVELAIEERQRFQTIVNKMHLRELDEILDLIEEVLEDAGRDIYLVIDQLDLQWADEAIRFKLIRALFDTAVSFVRIPRAKVILAMRVDLLERVYRDARHEPGTQSENIRDHFLTLSWDKGSLLKLLDERINRLVSDHYAPNYRVTHKDLLSATLRKGRHRAGNTVDYILERTWFRPRDVIDFFNACIDRCLGSPRISDSALLEAESIYSRNRLQSLAEEWQLEYPNLDRALHRLLSANGRRFRLQELTEERIWTWVEAAVQHSSSEEDRLRALADAVTLGRITADDARLQLAADLYKIGAIGVQTDDELRARWANNTTYTLSPSEIQLSSWIYVHAALWSALGVK